MHQRQHHQQQLETSVEAGSRHTDGLSCIDTLLEALEDMQLKTVHSTKHMLEVVVVAGDKVQPGYVADVNQHDSLESHSSELLPCRSA